MALGANLWTVYNDSKECNDGESYTSVMTFSACTDDQFTCKEGNCVEMKRRCDGKIDCFDKTDEMECELIMSDNSYSKGISPPPKKNKNVNDIFLSVDIEDILKVDEIGKVFRIKFILYATWIDSRLTYQNLKKNPNLNVLDLDGRKRIWTSVIIFRNTEDSQRSKIDDESLIRVLPNRDFTYKKSDKTISENIYYFHGSENILELSRTYRVDFICSYDMASFPFDSQTCSLNFEQNKVRFKL